MFYLIGALFGLFSVAFGAAAEHLIHPHITDTQWEQILTALRYQRMAAIMLIINGITLATQLNLSTRIYHWLQLSSILFVLGGIFFSLSIELSITFHWPSLISLAPIGGTAFCFAWLSLVIVGFLIPRRTTTDDASHNERS